MNLKNEIAFIFLGTIFLFILLSIVYRQGENHILEQNHSSVTVSNLIRANGYLQHVANRKDALLQQKEKEYKYLKETNKLLNETNLYLARKCGQ